MFGTGCCHFGSLWAITQSEQFSCPSNALWFFGRRPVIGWALMPGTVRIHAVSNPYDDLPSPAWIEIGFYESIIKLMLVLVLVGNQCYHHSRGQYNTAHQKESSVVASLVWHSWSCDFMNIYFQDELGVIDHHIVYTCCPYVGEYFLLSIIRGSPCCSYHHSEISDLTPDMAFIMYSMWESFSAGGAKPWLSGSIIHRWNPESSGRLHGWRKWRSFLSAEDYSFHSWSCTH